MDVGECVSLDDLPEWAQVLIVDTAVGLLEDSNAYAERIGSGGGFLIRAHGFTYIAQEGAERVF